MSWPDRPYDGEDYGNRPASRWLPFHRPTMLVTWLIIINVAVYIFQLLVTGMPGFQFARLLGLSLSGITHLQVWQLVTYMFVQETGEGGIPFHLIFNMLILYPVGMEIERGFGRERFLRFYFTCGLIGGLAYLVLGTIIPQPFRYDPVVGASGAIWGLLMAAMMFYPSMQIIFFVFPMSIRVFGAIMLGIFIFQMVGGDSRNLGGDICHLCGALAAVGMVSTWGIMPRVRVAPGTGPLGRWSSIKSKNAWGRKQERLAAEQARIDRILDKVHRKGIASLTHREKKALARATHDQQERDRQTSQIDRV